MRYAQLPVAALACLLSCFFADARAQSPDASPARDGDADVERRVFAPGEGTTSGEGSTVRAAISRPDADATHPAWSGAFALTGGSWTSAEPDGVPDDEPFANGFE